MAASLAISFGWFALLFKTVAQTDRCHTLGRGRRGDRVSKPYKFIGLGAVSVTKPYIFLGFGAMDVTQVMNDARVRS